MNIPLYDVQVGQVLIVSSSPHTGSKLEVYVMVQSRIQETYCALIEVVVLYDPSEWDDVGDTVRYRASPNRNHVVELIE